MTKFEIINNILCFFICIMWVCNIIQEVYLKILFYNLYEKLNELRKKKD